MARSKRNGPKQGNDFAPEVGHGNDVEEALTGLVADLHEFERFRKEVLPQLRSLVAKGADPEKILERFTPHAAAKLVTIALSEADSGKALTAIKDIMDRTKGKAVERKQVEHRFSKLSDEELDALLNSASEELEDLDTIGLEQ